jgi:3-deoxy-D-manno-octulosonate 8-phosphate phosphatase (KDO 8-P phosphatase)
MKYLFEGHTDKLPLFNQILEESGYTADQIGYVGDDITDIPILKRAGFAAAPSNSRPEILEMVHYRIPSPGGSGAIRDVMELLLKAQGKWDDVWNHYDV